MSERFLEGKTALVTGSVQGIGLAVAVRLARAGAAVVLHGLASPAQAAEAKAAVRAAGALEIRFFDADLREPAAIDAPLAEMPPERWDAILAVNLSAAFHTMRRALPGMVERGYGRVVNIASVHGLVASVNKAPYVASKFGLVGLTRVAALECAAAGSRASGGVTVNCIAPGWTETAIIEPQVVARAASLGGSREAAIRDLLGEKQPSLRTSEPSEIAEVAAMLCQPWAHNLTGITVPVDGGWTAQ